MEIPVKAALLAIVVSWCAYGQSAAPPEFEVASVKPSMSLSITRSGGPGTSDPGQFTCQGCVLRDLILRAYDIRWYQLIGPGWLNNTRFDVYAKVPKGATKEHFGLMLQDLLAKRFKLTAHQDRKEMAAYNLKIDKGGPKFKEWTDAPPPAPGAKKTDPPVSGMGPAPDGGVIRRMLFPMDQVAVWLELMLLRPVFDETGLKGRYDITLHYFPESASAGADLGPDLVEAVHSQLGLKLEPVKRMIDVRMVDHVERVPTGN